MKWCIMNWTYALVVLETNQASKDGVALRLVDIAYTSLICRINDILLQVCSAGTKHHSIVNGAEYSI